MSLILFVLLWIVLRYVVPKLLQRAGFGKKKLVKQAPPPVWQDKPIALKQHKEAVGEPLETGAKIYAAQDQSLQEAAREPAKLVEPGAPSPLEKRVNADQLKDEVPKSFWQTNLGRQSLRRAFVMSEVLGKPKALQSRREEW